MLLRNIRKSLLPLAAGLALAASPAAAQNRQPAPSGPPGTNPEEVKILSLTDLKDYEKNAHVLGNRSGGKRKTWGVFDVTFATRPDWIDEMTITYTVVFLRDVSKLPPAEKQKPLSLFQVTVSYPDIAAGKDHKAGAVLLPAALLRYGKCIGFAVQIFVGGNVVAEQGVASESKLKQTEKWWSNPQILGADALQKRDGYLIDRAKSPFHLVEIDNYEESR